MRWIVQENVCQEAKWTELISSLERLNIQHSVHKVVPFTGDLIPEPIVTEDKVFCYGSISMLNVAKRNNWKPGVIEVPDYQIQMNSPWKQFYLNSKPIFRYVWQLADKLLLNDHYFIKPDNDSKFISGQVMTREEIKQWAYNITILGDNDGSNVNKDSIVQLSEPTNKIRKEARFWIINDHVVTFSLYKLGKTIIHDRKLVDSGMSAFAHWLCSMMSTYYWRPADAYCLDICEISDNEYRIVEINNINSSGLYDADTQMIVHNIGRLKI